MSYPITLNVTVDFSNGATFGIPFTIGDPVNGILGVSTLGDTSSGTLTVDVSNQVGRVSIKTGYNLLQDQFEAGQATIRIYDQNGDWNPDNPLSPYAGKLLPNRKVRVSATYNSSSYWLFSGYTSAYNYSYPKDQELGYVDIQSTDAFRLFNLSNVTTVSGATAGETTGSRMGDILSQISWPATMRTLDTGDSTVQADPGTARTALQTMKNVEFSEQGAFYMSVEGQAVFKSRKNLQKMAGGAETYFSNAGDGIGYFNITTALDDKLVINQANITRIGGTTQSASDATSIAAYFPHSMNQPNLVVETDAEALNIAKSYVATRKDTSLRIDNLTLDLCTPDYDAGITAALSLDYFNVVKIKNVQQGTTFIEKTLEVVGVSHEITPTDWRTSFTTSEPIIEAFIIGSSAYGIIGQSVMTYQENIMATGFPAATGDVLSAAMYNGLPAFTLNAQTGTTYTTVLTDSYQVLITQSNASANAIKIPTNASVAHPIGTVITVLNIGAGLCTISAVTSGTTTILSAGAVAAAPTLPQYKSAACIKTGTDSWYVVGAIS